MKRTSLLAAAVAIGFCFSNPFAVAQQNQTRAQQDPASAQQDRGPGAAAGNLDKKTTGPNIRASELIGMNIQNLQGDQVGEVEDIVLNVRTGKVNYAAVSYGGFLGIGDNLFAVPFEAFKVGKERGQDEYVLVLDVTKEQLEGAEGFDKDSWPNFADEKFVMELKQRYKVERRPNVDRRNRNRNTDVDVERRPNADRQNRNRDVDVDVEKDRDGVDIKVKRAGDRDPE